jgi:hypothetical protein
MTRTGTDDYVPPALAATELSGPDVRASNDVIISSTYVPDFVRACLDLLADHASGLIHLTNRAFLSWADCEVRRRPGSAQFSQCGDDPLVDVSSHLDAGRSKAENDGTHHAVRDVPGPGDQS